MAADVDTYQRKVRELSARVRELEEERTSLSATHRDRVRMLEGLVQEGTSAAMQAAHLEIRSLRDQVGAARAAARENQRKTERIVSGLRDHFMESHGMTPPQAIEQVLVVMGEAAQPILIQDQDVIAHRKGMPTQVIEQIQRAQGRRR